MALLKEQNLSVEMAFQESNSSLLSCRSALRHTESRLCELERLLNSLSPDSQAAQSGKRSFDDEYVLSLRAELEDEIRLRGDAEQRAEGVETRLAETLAAARTHAAETGALDADETDRSLIHEVTRRELGASRSALASTEAEVHSLNAVKEELELACGTLRAQLLEKEAVVAALQTELEASQGLLASQHSISGDTAALLSEKDDEILSLSSELDLLKRDARALRDQLVFLHQEAGSKDSSGLSTPVARSGASDSRKEHFRSTSAPFSPSPLRHASYPPDAPATAVQVQNCRSQTLSHEPDELYDPDDERVAHGVPEKDSSAERAVVMIARLREERDEAVSSLSFYLVEHRITSQALQEELDALVAERENLSAALQELQESSAADAEGREQAEARLLEAEEREAQQSARITTLVEQLEPTKEAYEALLAARPDKTIGDAHPPLSPAPAEDQSMLSTPHSPAARPSVVAAEQIHYQISQLHDKLEEVRAVLSERDATIATLVDERDTLSEQLRERSLALTGAQNATLELQQRCEATMERLEHYRTDSAAEKEELQGELDYVRTYLDGAQNLVIELEDDKKRLASAKEGLSHQLGSLQAQLAEAQLRRVQTEEELLEILESNRRLHTERIQSDDTTSQLVICLAQAARMKSAADAIMVNLRTEAHSAWNALAITQAELADITAQRLAAQASLDRQTLQPELHTADPDENRQQLSLLVLILIEASRELSRVRAAHPEKVDVLAREVEERGALADQLLRAEENRARLQYALEESQRAVESMRTDHASEMEGLVRATTELETWLEDSKQKEGDLSTRLAALQQETAEREGRFAGLESDIARQEAEIASVQGEVSRKQDEIDALRESLRAAEEEGKNLVADFNLLSEEFEKKQMEDETKTLHSETQHTQLLEARAALETLQLKHAEVVAREEALDRRKRKLESELEAKQLDVEEVSQFARGHDVPS